MSWKHSVMNGLKLFQNKRDFPGDSVAKNLPSKQETGVQSLSWEDPLKKEMATYSSILAWEISWAEEPYGLSSVQFSSVPFSCSVLSDSLGPRGLQDAGLPCPSPTPGACSHPPSGTRHFAEPQPPLSWMKQEWDGSMAWWFNGHELEQTPGVGDGQGGLACCSPWGHKESDTTERLNWTE